MVPDYAQIDMPVEILHGDADTTVLAEHSFRAAGTPDRGCEPRGMQGVGHAPHHSEPETVTAAIDPAARRAGLR